MKRLLSILLLALAGGSPATAQFSNFADQPVEIDSEQTSFSSGVAIAEGNVIISYGDTIIHCDYAEYNPDTRDVLVRDNVRIYREGRVFTAERGFYNFETKLFRTVNFRSELFPFHFAGDTLGTLGPNEFKVRNGTFTTSDSSNPDYQIKAKSVRIYPKDRIVFSNVTFHVGKVPIFYLPYFYQSLDKEFGYMLAPGYSSRWGAFLLTQSAFPINEKTVGKIRLDYRSKRGMGVGFEAETRFGHSDRSWARFRAYKSDDSSTSTNPTTVKRGTVDSDRYRVSLQSRFYLTDDLYTTVDINSLSDKEFLEDFEPSEFRLDPQPDNVVSLTKWDENYTATLLGRFDVNTFFQTTARLPELVFDFKRSPLLDTRAFYEGQTGFAQLRRTFEDGSVYTDYDSFRFDTFHQLLFPNTYFGWLSFIPRIGGRLTYYSSTGHFEDSNSDIFEDGLSKADQSEEKFYGGGSTVRPVLNAGFESSFKFSREFADVQSRAWGLDGLRHVVQPYTNFSLVWSGEDPNDILQFDRYIPSTQLAPIDMTGFTAIDAIDNWTVWRFGVRNRLQTRRDERTLNWLELDSYFDVNIDAPDFPGATESGRLSNFFNNLRWRPLPWMSFDLDSQVPLSPEGFTSINGRFNFMVSRNLLLNVGHRYINDNPYFTNSSLSSIGGYYRINENWGFSVRENYEFTDGVLESQRYTLHRDLSSWVASFGVILHDNRGKSEYGVLLNFTLKDLPQANLPLAFDPQGFGGEN